MGVRGGFTVLPDTGVTAGSYNPLQGTVDAKGRLTAASAGSSGAYAVAAGASGLKTFEGTLQTDGGSLDVGLSGLLSTVRPRFVAGRTDTGINGYLPTGTVLKFVFRCLFTNSSGGANSTMLLSAGGVVSLTLEAFGQTAGGGNANKIKLNTLRDSDGVAVATDLASNWADQVAKTIEVLITIQGDSATANARIYDVVVKVNGVQAASLASQRLASQNTATSVLISTIGAQGDANGPGCVLQAPPLFQVVLP